ncbi:MAG: DinB family protein [Flavobacteriales bacterium]|nr:DinB family protein [Flavobacteriales bacterium]|tara:strand:+ start:643 stop:1107 length:465 start_codon:yes stop_codon:yes gene_type:complete
MDQQFEILLITRKNLLNSMKDLSIGELTKIPNGFNNNIIWNAAHNLATQQLLVYKLSGQSPIIPGELIEKYRKGTSAPKNVSENEINEIKGLLISSAKLMQQDYDNGLFTEYSEYTTSYNITLSSAEDAIAFNNVHEGLHFGYIMGLKKAIGSL